MKLAMSYVLLVLTVIAGCTTTQSRFVVLGSPQSDRPENCEVQVFRNGTPQHQFARVARIDVHVERTFFMQPGFEDALPELRRQACLSGADALIEIEERQSAYVENRTYHVTAVGVKYRR